MHYVYNYYNVETENMGWIDYSNWIITLHMLHQIWNVKNSQMQGCFQHVET